MFVLLGGNRLPIIVDLDGTVMRWNRAAQALLGWTTDDQSRQAPVRFGPGMDRDPLQSREEADECACLTLTLFASGRGSAWLVSRWRVARRPSADAR